MNLKEFIKNPIELEYFEGLLAQLNDKKEALTIATPENDTGVYPTAIAPRKLLRDELPFHSYEDIKQRYSTKEVVDCTLWLRKMHGGLGSSLDRSDYLKKYGRTTPGSKSTDLYIETEEFGDISLAEAQIIQASKKTSSFKKVVLQDLVNNDVKPILDEMWKKHAHLLNENFQRLESVVQQKLPTIKDGKLTTERLAPAGHGIFGYEVFKGPRPEGENIVACIGNGEDLSSTPDRAIVNWMLTENIPVVMVTTTKTERDMKGGQIALKVEGDKTYLTIVEKAQAEQAGQLEYFEKLGLREEDDDAFFNTNLVLINFSALDDCEIALPDLIKNQKGEFVQLEGAMGSVLLNSDRLARLNKTKLVHILNVNKENRSKFFNPIKKLDDFGYILDNQKFDEDIFHFQNQGKMMNKEISYPDAGHDKCFEVEDNSFWFKSRNKVIHFITKKFNLGSSFADVGGGNGYVSQYLKRQNKDVVVNLIEPGKKGCENANKRDIDNIYNTTIDNIDITLDSLGLFDVVEHIEKPIPFLQDCRNKLNNKGKLYITVPAYQILWSQEDIHAGHFRRYTKATIKRELEKAGFKVLYSSYFFLFLVPFIFILRAIPYKLGKREVQEASNDHKSGFMGLVIEKILDLELSLLKLGISFPIGASILICAQKDD